MDLNHARLPIPPLRPVTIEERPAGRLEGRDYSNYSYKAGTECQTWDASQHPPYVTLAIRTAGYGIQIFQSRGIHENAMTGKRTIKPRVDASKEITRLRALAHDLSNSLEAILQATYLLDKAKLPADSKRWVKLIDSSSQEAARINREIRDLLRALSEAH
jgi:signal transduction histidine kinase